MKKKCSKCNEKTINPRPAKFSPDDPYGDYRRKAKRKQLEEEGLLWVGKLNRLEKDQN